MGALRAGCLLAIATAQLCNWFHIVYINIMGTTNSVDKCVGRAVLTGYGPHIRHMMRLKCLGVVLS